MCRAHGVRRTGMNAWKELVTRIQDKVQQEVDIMENFKKVIDSKTEALRYLGKRATWETNVRRTAIRLGPRNVL